jgi:hypothetical protein
MMWWIIIVVIGLIMIAVSIGILILEVLNNANRAGNTNTGRDPKK